MELTHDDVVTILKLLESSEDIEYLDVRVGDTHIVASRHTAPGMLATNETAPSLSPSTPPPSAAAAEAGGPAPMPVPTPAPAPAEADAVAGPAAGSQSDSAVPVTAPVVGIFYRAPEPGASPYVELGSAVEADTTVGLVEVMKTFNSVTAGVSGRVVEILADDEEFVEYGQSLLVIEPRDGAR